MTDVLNPPLPSTARSRFRPLKVIALAGRGASARHVQAAFAEHDQFTVHVINPAAPDLSRALTKPDLVVVECDLSDIGAGPAVERLIAGDLKGAPVLVFADALAPDAARRLMRIGASEVLETASATSDIVAAALHASGARKNETSARLSAFFSARGGVGVSTLSVELALAIARENPRKPSSVCLIDLNFQFSAAASMLNVESKFNPSAALEPERVDAQLLQAYLSQHASGLSVLAAPTSWRSVRAPADGIACLLDVAATQFDHLVIDLPHSLSAVSEAVIANVDELFIVSDLSVPGIQMLREAVLELDSRMRSGGQPTIVLNRVPRHGRGATLTLDDVRRVIKGDRLHVIHEDASIAAEAGERGESIMQVAPDSMLAREIAAAVRNAMPRGAQTTPDNRKSAFFNLMRIR
ncbi:MAG: P-loop NTPase [Proteobacteria bacterium]|nr:P-loop NTPase [Pseudomonadota bacterium]